MNTDRAVDITVGAHVCFDGQPVRIVEMDGSRVVVSELTNPRLHCISVSRFIDGLIVPDQPEPIEQITDNSDLTPAQRKILSARVKAVVDILHRAEHEPLRDVLLDAGRELGIAYRTLQSWIQRYKDCGAHGLRDRRWSGVRKKRIDERWLTQVRAYIAGARDEPRITTDAIIDRINAQVVAIYGSDTVTLPSQATAYRWIDTLAKGTNLVDGTTAGKRSIADRPQGKLGRLRASRPGQYVVLDTHDLDIFGFEPVTSREIRLQLTVALDLYTRCVLGMRVSAVSTKALDVADVLFDAMYPRTAPTDTPDEALWNYHGIPQNLVFTEDSKLWGKPFAAPETVVIDNGKAFLSSHVISVCVLMGVSIQPAQPYKPTDKPTVERFFRTLETGIIQHLRGFKANSVANRGARPEGEAFFFVHEVEQIIREWVASVYHRDAHSGLCDPRWPRKEISPNTMYEIGVAATGLIRFPKRRDDVYNMLETRWRTIQHYGVEIDGLKYDGDFGDYRGARSDYKGKYTGRWPIRIRSADLRFAYFQNPETHEWVVLKWEHADALDMPFSRDASAEAALLAFSKDPIDRKHALKQLLQRFQEGDVRNRRERRIAAQLSAESQPLQTPDAIVARTIAVGVLPASASPDGATPPRPHDDVDDEDDLDDYGCLDELDPESDQYWADALKVLD